MPPPTTSAEAIRATWRPGTTAGSSGWPRCARPALAVLEAAKRHGVHRQEVTRHDAGRLPTEELAPGGARPARGGLDSVVSEDLGDRAGRHSMAESEEFTSDSLVAPPRIVVAKRTISPTSPSASGGRPLGVWSNVQCGRSIRRCQRSRVSGRTTNTDQRSRAGADKAGPAALGPRAPGVPEDAGGGGPPARGGAPRMSISLDARRRSATRSGRTLGERRGRQTTTRTTLQPVPGRASAQATGSTRREAAGRRHDRVLVLHTS
jgi:hypothetical protein